jgi:hypothetical protein
MSNNQLALVDRDEAFWCSFHPADQELLLTRLLVSQAAHDTTKPYDFEAVYKEACTLFSSAHFRPIRSAWSGPSAVDAGEDSDSDTAPPPRNRYRTSSCSAKDRRSGWQEEDSEEEDYLEERPQWVSGNDTVSIYSGAMLMATQANTPHAIPQKQFTLPTLHLFRLLHRHHLLHLLHLIGRRSCSSLNR